MSVDEGPTLRRRRLGAELKRCREGAGSSQENVSRPVEVTGIETARVAVTARDVRDLCHVQDQASRAVLNELDWERTWWTDYRDVIRPGNFVGLEAGASSMRTWEPVILPGSLQTEAYIRALMRTGRPAARRRPPGLAAPDPPGTLTERRQLGLGAVVDESVVRRMVGGGDVMAEQLRHLVEAARTPNVTLQILPFAQEEHQFLGGAAAQLEFRETTHLDVVYLEGPAGDSYGEQPAEVARYRGEFERLSAKVLDSRMAIKMIESPPVAGLRSRRTAFTDPGVRQRFLTREPIDIHTPMGSACSKSTALATKGGEFHAQRCPG